MNAKDIIEAIGAGVIARATGMPVNTVSHWKRRGIPTRHWLAIARAAAVCEATAHITFEVISGQPVPLAAE